MTTPPMMPMPGGNQGQQLLSALMASVQAQTQASRQIQQSLQAMQHMMATYGTSPAGPTPPMPMPPSGVPSGNPTPSPVVPTHGWLQQQATSALATAAGQRLTYGRSAASGASMSWAMPGGGYASLSAAPQQRGSGVGGWALQHAPQMLGARFGPWGAAAGVALQVGAQVPAEVRSQRDKNSYYQAVEGGSNFAGFGERLHEEAYRWSTFGVFSSDEARNAFKGVTRLGYNSKVEGGPGRQEALNFLYHGKTSYGASVDEGLQTLQVASQSAVSNLKELSSALKDVSDTAGKAGINAQQARADFTQMVGAASQGGMGGNAATGAARLAENTKSMLGRSFQSADYSGQMSLGYSTLAAGIGGVKLGDYLTNRGGAQTRARSVTEQAFLQQVLKPGVREWVKGEISRSEKTPLDDASRQDIAERMLQTFYNDDALALSAALSLVLPDGANDPVRAAVWVVTQIENESAGGITNKAASDIASKSAQDAHQANMVQHVSGGQAALDHEAPWYQFGMGGSKAVQAYSDWSKKNGFQDDPVVRALLGKVKGDNNTKVLVTTKDGKKVVSLEEAVKNHRDELAAGNAIIMEGDKSQVGHTVKDLVGSDKVDPLRDFKGEAGKSTSSGPSLTDWEKSHQASGGGLTIGLTPEAKRLLTVLETSGTSGAAAAASPPQNPNATFPSLPSVGG